MFTVKIMTDNAAFDDCKGEELARLLREIAEKLECGRQCGTCHDVNGNYVGEWSL